MCIFNVLNKSIFVLFKTDTNVRNSRVYFYMQFFGASLELTQILEKEVVPNFKN